MTRRSKQDWLEIGLMTLGEEGNAAALTIDGLSTRLGVTKGSFYHHFDNAQDFKEQLLTYWEDTVTHAIIAATEGAESLSERLDRLLAGLLEHPPEPEAAIRAWALQDDWIKSCVGRVDQYRIGQIQAWLREKTGDDKQALLAAQVLYTMLVGCYSITPPLSDPDSVLALYRVFKRFYGI